MGVDVLTLAQRREHVSIRRCLRALGKRGVTSLLVEGGGELNASFLREGLVNQVYLYVAPILMGGHNATGLLGGLSPGSLADAVAVSDMRLRFLGEDVLVTGSLPPGP